METEMMNRSVPPAAAPLEKILFPTVRRAALRNGVDVYMLQFGSQEVMELVALFPAGKCFEPAAAVSNFTAKMIQEGTRHRNSLEFARAIDNFGAFVHVESGYEAASVGLTTLSKHIQKTVPLWAEMILEPSMPEMELEKMRERSLQHLDVEEQKTGYIARREFNRLLFGAAHPYGAPGGKAEIAALQLADLKAFHQSHFHPGNAVIVAVGRFDEAALLDSLNATLGQQALAPGQAKVDLGMSHGRWQADTPATGLQYFEKPDSVQATLRVGHRAFARSHPDYYPMQVVNTVYGGYFGSRLMKNIREDKGYTYGVGSAWLSMKYDGLFLVQTDVDNAYIEPTLREIKMEMDRLIAHGVSDAELDLVRNYTLGRSATGRETPSQLNQLMQNALINGFDFQDMDQKFDIVMGLTAADIQRLARHYFDPAQLLEVVCGKM
jgi:zinc protease